MIKDHLDITTRVELLNERTGLSFIVKKMFGGVGYLLGGNMAYAASMKDGDVLVRVHDAQRTELLKLEWVSPTVMGQRNMKNWVLVNPVLCDDDELERLLAIGREYALSLPPK
ncbi:MAG TPA: TfoX/Sxy family protein [Candidatus Saccharimonadales bacterium]|jgi:TfoX/Sxy family transcriptional regulator of competence genes